MSTQQKNGATIPTNGKANPEKVNTTVTLAAVKKEEAVKIPVELSPLEERLYRITQLFELQGKHSRLVKSQQKLNEFQLAKGEENISLTLDDSSNRKIEFSTSNPDVIREVLACLQTTIKERTKIVEALLVV